MRQEQGLEVVGRESRDRVRRAVVDGGKRRGPPGGNPDDPRPRRRCGPLSASAWVGRGWPEPIAACGCSMSSHTWSPVAGDVKHRLHHQVPPSCVRDRAGLALVEDQPGRVHRRRGDLDPAVHDSIQAVEPPVVDQRGLAGRVVHRPVQVVGLAVGRVLAATGPGDIARLGLDRHSSASPPTPSPSRGRPRPRAGPRPRLSFRPGGPARRGWSCWPRGCGHRWP